MKMKSLPAPWTFRNSVQAGDAARTAVRVVLGIAVRFSLSAWTTLPHVHRLGHAFVSEEPAAPALMRVLVLGRERLGGLVFPVDLAELSFGVAERALGLGELCGQVARVLPGRGRRVTRGRRARVISLLPHSSQNIAKVVDAPPFPVFFLALC